MQEYLIYIKQEIKRKIKLEPSKVILTDSKFIPLLKKEFSKDNHNLNNNSNKCHYLILYTALYFDNLSILKLLNDNNFSLGIYPSNLSLYLLDNSFTKFFTKDSYLPFITRYKPYFHSFFLSIKDLPPIDKENYIKRFIHLVTFLDNTLKQLESNHYNLINSLFTKKALDTFSDTAYFKASIYQLTNIIAPLEMTPNKNTIKRLNNLITTTNFSMFCHNYDLMFELFSDEELLNMSTSPEYFFTKALNNKLDLTRVIYVYRHNPDIINNMGLLCPNIFNSYSNDEIIILSKTINFSSPNASKELKNYNFKRRVLSLLPWTK